MLVHTKDYDCSTDYRILNLLKPIYKVVGLNHGKRSIGNVKIRPIQEYLFLFIEKQRWPLTHSLTHPLPRP